MQCFSAFICIELLTETNIIIGRKCLWEDRLRDMLYQHSFDMLQDSEISMDHIGIPIHVRIIMVTS